MSIFENTVLIDKKPSKGNLVGRIACIVLLALFLVLSFLPEIPGLFLLPAILVIVVFYFLHKGTKLEYEYTYIEGQLSFAKIKAKSKRKDLEKIDMEDVILIAPENSSELRAYQNDRQKVSKRDYTSGFGEGTVYEVVYKLEESIAIIRFEPDMNMLEMMQPRNMRKVIIAK